MEYWSDQQTARPMLHAIKKTRIHEEVVTQIHDLIREGRLKAGDQLPSERELSETFKVSRTSVREALRALETKGLIISRTGMGNFIADLPIESLIAPLAKLLIEEKLPSPTFLSSVSSLNRTSRHWLPSAQPRKTSRE